MKHIHLSLLALLSFSTSVLAVANVAHDGLSGEEWSSIRDAYETGRHAAYATEDGYQARNPGQRWSTRFDGRGFVIEPDEGGWTWGLELLNYGFEGREQAVSTPARIRPEGSRVAYDWGEALEEWYVNDRRGLEHGYTVYRRPPCDGEDQAGSLTFTLLVQGELSPEVEPGGCGIRFLDGGGGAVLTYTGLCVLDADGRRLDARIEQLGDRLRISVNEYGAHYPLTIDPVAQQAYIKASNTDASDHFGNSVAIWGDYVVIGAPGEKSNATGVNGDQSDDSMVGAGAAYVFLRNGTSWTQQAYLKASNPGVNDYFGAAVAISGDTVVVGAVREDSGATGVGGDQSDNSALGSGAAYVFVRNGASWSQQAYVKASNTGMNDGFGETVAVSGDVMVVGAPDEDSIATGVNGDQNNNHAPWAGAAYVFARSGSTWTQWVYLKASNTDGQDGFGKSVAVKDSTIVIGARGESSNATGVNGDQSDDSVFQAGAAYVFVRAGSTWSQQAYLKASNTGEKDLFGTSVAVSGDTVAIGASLERSGATGVNGDQSDNSAYGAGAVYVFVRDGSTWSQQAYVKASNTDAEDHFGASVSVSADTLVVGAQGESSNTAGVDGDQNNNDAADAGAAYVFSRSGTNWGQQAYLKASNTNQWDWFGYAVSVSSDTIVVGALLEWSAATGVNGDQSDNSAPDAGAAYVFRIDPPPGTGFCFGDPGVDLPCPCFNDNDESVPGSGCANGAFASGAHLTGSGLASVRADSLVLTTTGLDPNNSDLYFQADNRINSGYGTHFGDGLRCAGGGLVRLQVRTSDATGTSNTTIAIGVNGGVSAGDTKRYQCWYRDTSGGQPCGVGVNDFNLSNGYEITWLP